MQLQRKQNAPTISSTEKREKIDTNENILMKEYLQSFLKWMFVQNPEFDKNLRNEDITNYFINELQHPIWFDLMFDKNRFIMMVAIDNYIHQYKSNANIMISSYQINPIKKLDYTLLDDSKRKFIAATQNQIKYIKSLMYHKGNLIDEDSLTNLSKNEASCIIKLLK